MRKPHWRQHTNALRKAAVARKAEAEAVSVEPTPDPVLDDEVAPEPVPEATAEPDAPTPRKTRRAKTPADSEPAAA